MLLITRQMDYGLLLMAALARGYGPRLAAGKHGVVSLRQIAGERRLPYRFLVKIALLLRRGGLLHAQEGAHGGYALARAPRDITIRQVLEALSEPISLVRCETSHRDCQSFCQCSSRSFWHQLQTQVNDVLDRTTVADLVTSSTPTVKPNVIFSI